MIFHIIKSIFCKERLSVFILLFVSFSTIQAQQVHSNSLYVVAKDMAAIDCLQLESSVFQLIITPCCDGRDNRALYLLKKEGAYKALKQANAESGFSNDFS